MGNRVVQTDAGTWLSHWKSIDSTKPLESRVWMCEKCFDKWRRLLKDIPTIGEGAFKKSKIDFTQVESKLGGGFSFQLRRFFKNRRIEAWERVERITELRLLSGVCCRTCRTPLNRSKKAFVEIPLTPISKGAGHV